MDPGNGGATRGGRGVPGRPCPQPQGAAGQLCTTPLFMETSQVFLCRSSEDFRLCKIFLYLF